MKKKTGLKQIKKNQLIKPNQLKNVKGGDGPIIVDVIGA